MANTDYSSQLTQIYNKLAALDSQVSKMALRSEMNTIQASLNSSMVTLSSSLDTLTTTVEKLEVTMSALLSELRSK
jgi:hypothetical protein